MQIIGDNENKNLHVNTEINSIRKYSEKKRFHENYEQGALTAFPSVLLCGNGRTMLDMT